MYSILTFRQPFPILISLLTNLSFVESYFMTNDFQATSKPRRSPAVRSTDNVIPEPQAHRYIHNHPTPQSWPQSQPEITVPIDCPRSSTPCPGMPYNALTESPPTDHPSHPQPNPPFPDSQFWHSYPWSPPDCSWPAACTPFWAVAYPPGEMPPPTWVQPHTSVQPSSTIFAATIDGCAELPDIQVL